jgi:hypothetical protein
LCSELEYNGGMIEGHRKILPDGWDKPHWTLVVALVVLGVVIALFKWWLNSISFPA